jgi:hypothetical protein
MVFAVTLAGTAIATCLTGLLPPGGTLAIVAIFAILALGAAAATGAPGSAALSQLTAADRELAMLTPTLRAARRFGIGAARQLDHTVTRARALASEVTVLATSHPSTDTEVTPPDDELAELIQRITRARRAIRMPPGSAPAPS